MWLTLPVVYTISEELLNIALAWNWMSVQHKLCVICPFYCGTSTWKIVEEEIEPPVHSIQYYGIYFRGTGIGSENAFLGQKDYMVYPYLLRYWLREG